MKKQPCGAPLRKLIIPLMLCSLSSPGYANENFDYFAGLSLEELGKLNVKTASRFDQPIADAQSVISVIHREQLLAFGAKNVAEALQYLPGFVPISDITYGRRGIAMRGDTDILGEHNLLLLDGKPYRLASTGVHANQAIFDSFPLDAIERIELIRGPGSVLYGSNAVSSVINIITRKEQSNQLSTTVQMGSFSTRKLSIHAAHNSEQLHSHITVQHVDTDGWRAQYNTGVMDFDFNYFNDQLALQAEVSAGGLSFRTMLINYNNNEPRAPLFIDNDEVKAQHRYYAVDYEGTLNNQWQLSAHLSHTDAVDSFARARDEVTYTEATVKKQLEKLEIIIGGSAEDATLKTSNNSINDYERQRFSVYGQTSYQWNDTIRAFLGAQWNKVDGRNSKTVPRGGIVYKSTDHSGLKLLYSEAFRSPTASETDAFVPPFFFGNDQIESETVKTVDLQWYHYQADNHFTATAFYSRYSDLIRITEVTFLPGMPPVVDEPGTVVQSGDRKTRGLEFEYERQLMDTGNIIASATWQQNEDREGNTDESLAPRWTLKTGYEHRFANTVSVALFNTHISSFKGGRMPANNPAPDSYDLLSLNIRVPLEHWSGIKSSELSIYGYNLLDEEIWQPELVVSAPNTIPVSEGRSAFVSIKLNW